MLESIYQTISIYVVKYTFYVVHFFEFILNQRKYTGNLRMKNFFDHTKRCTKNIFVTILLITTLFAENMGIVFADDGKNVTQNWAAAAVFYNSPAQETETFHMTEEEFLQHKAALESRLVFAYSTYYNRLQSSEKKLLEETQKAWIDCYYAYIEALEQRWLRPVKIFFGVTGKERRTNIYREFVLLLLSNRITDLEEWNAEKFVRMETDFAPAKTEELKKSKEQLQVDMGLCLYVIQEEYRLKIKEAHRKFYIFLDSNEKFISLMSNNNEAIITAEGLLQVQRMSYLTSVHYQGCRFFRREREE